MTNNEKSNRVIKWTLRILGIVIAVYVLSCILPYILIVGILGGICYFSRSSEDKKKINAWVINLFRRLRDN